MCGGACVYIMLPQQRRNDEVITKKTSIDE
jgi:phosphomethylpyrimidine synthase